jgi:D-sedoheptulose 7-phosphate isomerase
MFSVPEHVTEFVRVLRHLDGASIERAVELVLGTWRANRTVFLCGNGGSAASAGHLAADLTKLTAVPRAPRLRAMALTDSLAAISAAANDISYDEVFVEQLRAFGQPFDTVIGLSTSGSSRNVLRAIEYANSIGAQTIGVTGRAGHPLRGLANHTIVIDSTSVQHVEDATMVTGHMVCLRVRDALQALVLEATMRPRLASAASLPPPKGFEASSQTG